MNCVPCTPHPATSHEIESIIEPLASYICAAEQPRTALISALAALLDEVDQTHRAALSFVNHVVEHRRP